ncbi:heat shock protein HspQ [Brevundimonas sp.]|uniref:heat shock protein HspQ n=1 Tax=Brevundimonas sp. TaxID=1871086 RepID=UPI002CE087F8|nr:heat shock protein HspQ [Brevundimonas sp.]HWQ87396.1 heat shock protein HspQ [Brevundimonas sp.]
MTRQSVAKFGLGQIVRHRDAAFRGVVIDIDPSYAGDPAETGEASPDQPYYQVLAIGPDGGFVAYTAESALEHDPELSALSVEAERRWFTVDARGRHAPLAHAIH